MLARWVYPEDTCLQTVPTLDPGIYELLTLRHLDPWSLGLACGLVVRGLRSEAEGLRVQVWGSAYGTESNRSLPGLGLTQDCLCSSSCLTYHTAHIGTTHEHSSWDVGVRPMLWGLGLRC